MNRRLLLNLVLLIAVAALIAVVYFEPGIEAPETPAALTTLDRAAVTRIRVERADDALELERRGEQWWVLGEPELPADPLQVDNLLRMTAATPRRSYATTELDLKQLGLDPAPVTVRFDDTAIAVGGTDPLEGLRYVQVGGRVALIPDEYHNTLQGKRTQLASRRLLPEGADVIALALPERRLRQRDDGGWDIDPPLEGISADAAQKLVQAWQHASALWVSAYTPAEGAAPVSVELADGTTIAFELRRGDRGVELARADLQLQYHLPEVTANSLLELERPAPDGGEE